MDRPPQASTRSGESVFYREYMDVVGAMRAALVSAFEAAGVDIGAPREAARRLGLDKNLAWKLSRIALEPDPARVARSVPGAAGVRLAVAALERAGIRAALVRGVDESFAAFDGMVAHHAEDRDSLELMLDGVGGADAHEVTTSRKLAYRGNSGVWGVRARVRLCAHFLVLSDSDPSGLVTAQVGGFFGFERLSAGPPWPLFRFRIFNDDGVIAETNRRPIDDEHPEGFPYFMSRFSRGTLPELVRASDEFGTSYELGDGPIGKTGASDLIYGYVDAVPRTSHRDEHNRVGEVLGVIDTPAETLLFDLIVQREFAERIDPAALVYGRATGLPHSHERRDARTLLPVTEGLRPIGSGAQMFATALAPGYQALGLRTLEALGRSADDCVGWRLIMPYPVMPSTAAIRFDLPERD